MNTKKDTIPKMDGTDSIGSEDFCRDWLFRREDVSDAQNPQLDDTQWERVHVPHTWNALDMAPGRPPRAAYVGRAWYRKRFQLAGRTEGERVFLLFEAVGNASAVWVDGAFVGGRNGGFLSFRLDITDALGEGTEHVLAVRADNSAILGGVNLPHMDWERYGGIYRPVWLQRKGDAYFDHRSIRITTPQVTHSAATVHVSVRVWECGPRSRSLRLSHRVLDAAGRTVCEAAETIATAHGRTASFERTLPVVAGPLLWSPDRPSLYRVESLLCEGARELDRTINPLGFRWTRWDPEKGFFLNDRPVKLCGANVHQEYPGLGNACPARFHRNEVRLMKDAGMNLLRTSHYPRNHRVLDACDEQGVMVIEEQPYWHGSVRARHGEAFIDETYRLIGDMVDEHANHPSIIAWNTVNEIMLRPLAGERHPDPAQRKRRHRLPREEWAFAHRAVAAINDALHRADPTRPTSVVVGGQWDLNEQAGISRLADIVAHNGGAWFSDADNRHVFDICKARDPGRISMMSEGVLNRGKTPARGDWEQELERWRSFAECWSTIYERDWFAGGTMWVLADYSANGTYRRMGALDFSRLPYEGYYFFQSQWAPALMAHICCHWSWHVPRGTPRTVVVFTNGAEAELALNGRSLGSRRPDRAAWPHLPHPPLEWQVAYEPGRLEVVTRRGTETCTDTRRTESEAHRVRLSAESDRLLSNGRDVAFFTATIVDRSGARCYNAAPGLEVRVSGAAALAGPTRIEARGGLARFAVRSNGTEGAARVNVAADGLPAGILTIPAGERTN